MPSPPDDPASAFAIRRQAAGLSQVDVLKRTPFRSLKPILRADRDLEGFTLRDLRTLAGALGISVQDLLRGSIEHPESPTSKE